MRKHNAKMATRWPRDKDDRSNEPQAMSHALAKDKGFQLAANGLLMKLLAAIGIKKIRYVNPENDLANI